MGFNFPPARKGIREAYINVVKAAQRARGPEWPGSFHQAHYLSATHATGSAIGVNSSKVLLGNGTLSELQLPAEVEVWCRPLTARSVHTPCTTAVWLRRRFQAKLQRHFGGSESIGGTLVSADDKGVTTYAWPYR